ncbi:histidine kinase [Mucilaginibacter sp. PAMC 26640]|nr:histidine kinase [Mucilaginibacter sp. PAMC 26640]
MENFLVDLTNCDKEPIHILGMIQSHGFLTSVQISTGLVNYVSENISPYINEHPGELLGKDLLYLANALHLNTPGSQFLFNQLVNTGYNKKIVESLSPYYVELAGKPYNIILALDDRNLIIEFEVVINDEFDSEKVIGASVSKILLGSSLQAILHNAAREIKKIIKYDRVMIYEFGDEGHGKVTAEEKNDDLEPFLNLYYPASDIPRQARELYKINLTRIIADVNTEPSRIITSKNEEIPLDLTHAELRAVSPMHIQYLKNMGVQSSFSISLICKGQLWGLVACHNYSPKFINFNARSAAKLIGQILSSAIEFRHHEESMEKFEVLDKASTQLIDLIDDTSEISKALTANSVTIKDITEASGVALLFENKITCLGKTPGETQILEINKWLLSNMDDVVYNTNRFPKFYKPAVKFSGVASGILACIISREFKEMIIWFKTELLENIEWAGNPEKPVEISNEGVTVISPRKSFESWTETVRHTSAKWARAEVTSVIKMREHILYAIKRKANEIRMLNEKLVLAYEELDTFSYTVSHDLRTPLSSIKSYSELLLNNDNLDDSAKKLLERIRKCTDKMGVLITEILNYSRVGQSEVQTKVIDMKSLLEEVKLDITESIKTGIDFIINDTPEVSGDPTMIKQVFNNLIGNAVKYAGKSKPSRVVVSGAVLKKETVYSIADNGIGIDSRYHHKVFELFKRMENAQDIEGTGVGLAIVKKIIEKHKARIWFESKLGEGTTFYVAFNKSP